MVSRVNSPTRTRSKVLLETSNNLGCNLRHKGFSRGNVENDGIIPLPEHFFHSVK